mmetsp:Transcript_26184/g.36156  ORF Transcript_26184/g.36156 Transcript_26184/m.36156 type:complete len:166 (-) Transcript_26184:92-589(-)|eukprot:CAMPEP_0196589582 /NCGR_PEP_ID=MMETSP1081-20130531/63971_1 /TAXON_ID=36882 /ORGANISM="Pyramimonas amylifera, Strain CCMP720" /LENGTH=165 /DNA_ID=CAMNT_0041912429 /DNA_START=105 /DNA_END=602 /DNA_ORIENTATION=+
MASASCTFKSAHLINNSFRSGQAVTCKAPLRVVTKKTLITTAGWSQLATEGELKAAGGRVVVKTEEAGKILIQEFMGEIYAVSNKCPHLGLPLQGKILTAEVTDAGCLVCPAHKSAFDLKTGEPKGEWCPGMPELPFVGKPLTGDPVPLPTYEVRLTDGNIEVNL